MYLPIISTIDTLVLGIGSGLVLLPLRPSKLTESVDGLGLFIKGADMYMFEDGSEGVKLQVKSIPVSIILWVI